ncbi:MAG: DUF1553 domain-containing protein [Cyclobacteriaceae bacterium]|nr:DUF1553 domain-containing protein [Cyclobacteriaceae bacterium]
MKILHKNRLIATGLILTVLTVVAFLLFPEEKIDYNSQVKPILNKHCISCHGGVKKNGGFSLLFEGEAKAETKSGHLAIIPGHPDKSEMIRRLTSDDPEERMPYEKPPLSSADIKILRKWIAQGAQWGIHWAYLPVGNPATPDLKNNDEFRSWGRNDIDNFIYEKIHAYGLTPSPRAALPILARRLSLDLIGLPPPPDSFDSISSAESDTLMDSFVDALMESPHFGEKWAGMWMDLARYSDTKGYERDDSRTIWKYRDWLIKSFNEDKPYDRFLIEQIAGDLFENPTEDDMIATAFHRNTMTNDEGGTDNEEFRVAAVIDRVNTTWETVMGTSFACVQCHSHPFDPIKHDEYYKVMAFFNNTRDEDTFDDYPVFRHFSEADSLNFYELKAWLHQNADQKKAREIQMLVQTWQPTINSLVSDQFVNSELSDTKWLVYRKNGSSRLRDISLDGKNTIIARFRSFKPGGKIDIHIDSLTGSKIASYSFPQTDGRWDYAEIKCLETPGRHDLHFHYTNSNLPDSLSNGIMFDWLYLSDGFPGKGVSGYEANKEKFWQLMKINAFQTPVMLENPPEMHRQTKVFERGNWLTQGETVQPGVPAFLELPMDNLPNNRLGLAQWITDPSHPLTARVYVNRLWEQLFGIGIVETLEDFGTQGIAPTHQALLDHLAWKFVHEFHWSTKKMLKYIVSSATYQQSSKSASEQLEIDPQNRLYARGRRMRLSAEQIRDQALVVSGLFSEKMYGPSVMPFQPENIWNSPYNGRKWVQNSGENQYRRALYTYWKRTGAYPSMLIFDAMPREVCASRRISTNTPLQALVTLNDPVYVEAADRFAMRMLKEGGNTPEEQISHGYYLMMCMPITEEKLNILINLYKSVKNDSLIKTVALRETDKNDSAHLAAMKIVANAMLNLDEFIMKN